MAEVKDYVFVNPEVSQKLEEMWNNQEFSDTLFLVNDVQFHASSLLVSVTSNVLKTMLDTHFKHCGDREMRIGSIKHDESFSVILKYIYGMGINFSQMDRAVLCEVVCQSERFELTSFSKVLKSYLSELDCFALDSAVVLLNTAKKYDIKKLYENLTLFAFEKADQLVKHETFINLQYDVLLDFLKADNFCAPEIDIFMAALAWHNDNMSKTPSMNEERLERGLLKKSYWVTGLLKRLLVTKVTESVTEEEEDASVEEEEEEEDASVYASAEEDASVDLALVIDSQLDEESDGVDNVRVEYSSKDISVDSTSIFVNSALVIPDQTAACTELMKMFSDKVLKSLLSHIRIKQIATFDFLNMFKSDLVDIHKEILSDSRVFSQNSKPRRGKFIGHQKRFIITFDRFNTKYESCEEYLIGDTKWKVCLVDTEEPCYKLDLYLKCTSDKESDWMCATECQLRLISHNAEYPDIVIPSDDKYIAVAFTPSYDCVKIGEHSFPEESGKYDEVYYNEGCKYTIDLHFKYILSE